MAKKTIEQLIEDARTDLHDKNIVAFLGEVGSGKTVVSALLKHALFNHFIPKSGGKYEAIVSSGNTIINQILGAMLKEGVFPPSTLPGQKTKLVIEIHDMSGDISGKVQLVLRDMSGENYADLLVAEYDDPKIRLNDLLTTNKSDQELSGPLAHLAFAKIYVLLIDCSRYPDWEHEQSYFAQMITAIKQIKELVKDTTNGKIHNPIAIIFTKTDLLEKEIGELEAEKLMQKLPELQSSLRLSHNGLINYFKMSVEIDKKSTENIEDRMKREEEAARAAFEKKKSEEKKEIERAIEKSYNDAKSKALSEGKNEEQAKLEAENARTQTKTYFDTQKSSDEFHFDKEQITKAPEKLERPLRYSESEYIRFISWILQTTNR